MGMKKLVQGLQQGADARRYNDSFEGLRIIGDQLFRIKAGKQWPVAGCSAQVDSGAAISSRVTATRVVAGAAIAGPIGAVVGALAKKDRSKVYLAVTTPDDHVLLELKGKEEGEARRFAGNLNAAAAHFASSATEDPEPAQALATTPAGWYPADGMLRWWDGNAWTDHTAPLTDSDTQTRS